MAGFGFQSTPVRSDPQSFGQKIQAGLQNPALAAALMQFGVNMMAGGYGTPLSRIGQSFGAGLAAAGRVGTEKQRRADADRKIAMEQDQQRADEQYRQATLAENIRSDKSREAATAASQALEAKKFSADELFRNKQAAKQKDDQSFLNWATKMAYEAAKQNNAASFDNPVTPDYFLNDPEWVGRARQSYETLRNAAAPAPASGPASEPASGAGVAPGKGDLTGGGNQAPASPGPSSGLTPDKQAVLDDARVALAQRPDLRAQILQRLQSMGIPAEGL